MRRIDMRMSAAIALLALAGCVARQPAPVIESRPPAPAAPPPAVVPPKPTVTGGEVVPPVASVPAKPLDPSKIHVVQRGETLIAIALAYGLAYRDLAAWNNITNPNLIKVGDALRLVPPDNAGGVVVSPLPSLPAGTPLPPQVTGGSVVVTPIGKPDEVIATPLPTPAAPVPDGRPLGNTATLKVEPKASKVPYSDKALAQADAAAPIPPAIARTAIPVPGSVTAPPVPVIAGGTVPPVVSAPSPSPSFPPPVVSGANATSSSEDPAWAWPLAGKPRIIANYSDANKGIDIAGAKGTPVLAAASGKVTYTGTQIRGYGRLVLVKHNNGWISAYAHNDKILVSEEDEVVKGQKIAEMGSSDADQVKLHFEIRKQGKPLDPLKFLPAQ